MVKGCYGEGERRKRESENEDGPLWLMCFNVHLRFPGPHHPPINSTFLFTDPPCTKLAFTYNCVKHHLPAP